MKKRIKKNIYDSWYQTECLTFLIWITSHCCTNEWHALANCYLDEPCTFWTLARKQKRYVEYNFVNLNNSLGPRKALFTVFHQRICFSISGFTVYFHEYVNDKFSCSKEAFNNIQTLTSLSYYSYYESYWLNNINLH